MPRIVYRKGPRNDRNFTPRPDKDIEPKPGVSPGFSVFARKELLDLIPKDRIQILDLDLLPPTLGIFADEVSAGGQDGHYSIAPVTEHGEIDMRALIDWASTRPSGGNHPLTGDLLLAVIGQERV